MKKILYAFLAAVITVSCAGGDQPDYNALWADLEQKADALESDASMSDEQKYDALKNLFLETYSEHKSDSLGLKIFVPLIASFCTMEEALALYEESSELIREDSKIKVRIECVRNKATVTPGNPYKEINGTDALTGEALKLSSFIGGGKALLVDFWASWCAPCRREIKSHLLELASQGRVNIVGVAVWEDSVEDTRKAMSELGISWPVIFTGGRENSPSIEYGVLSIPTLFLISPEGTIIASGHSIEDFADKL